MPAHVKRALLLGAFIVFAGLLSSCVGPAFRELDAGNNGETIEVKTGDTISLELEGNPSTGYLWTFGAPLDESLIIQTGESIAKTDPSSKRVGAPVKQYKNFKAIAPGRTGIKLDYRRPWERGVKPVKTFEVLIVISGETLEPPQESDETPRIGSDGKPAKEPEGALFKGPPAKPPAENPLLK